MELTGLGLAQVLAVLGAFGAGVVVLYLLKLRRRRVHVPFVRLWDTVLAEKKSTRLFSQLKRWLSLLVALTVVALLAWALGDPRRAGGSRDGRTLVVLVDASASMKARDVAPSRFEEARTRVRGLIDELGPADRMLVAQMDATTTPRSPLTDEPELLRDALGEMTPTDLHADADAALSLALDVLRGAPSPEVVIVGDGGLDGSPALAERAAAEGVRLSFVPVGKEANNVGIRAFAVRRYPLDKSQAEVLVELWNPTENAARLELTLLGDGQPVSVEPLEVPAGERLQRFFGNLSGIDRVLEARIAPVEGGVDYLPADDRAYARLPERRRARVLVVSRGNLYLEAALLLDEYLDVTAVAPEGYTDGGAFDVVIFDDWVPASPPRLPALYLHPAPREGGAAPLEVTGTVASPYFDHVDRRHPLVRWTALGDVNVAEALEVRLSPGDRAVARSSRTPLIVTGEREGRRFVAFTFDVRRSDLPLRVAWPLLLLNAIDLFVQEGAGYASSFATGEPWYVPVPAGTTEATVVTPSGVEGPVAVADGRAVLSGAEVGLYTLRTASGEETFAANLGADGETAIAPRRAPRIGERALDEPTRGRVGVRERLWIYLVALALLILGVEWFTYHRRWTV